jgi:hypothetical protein
MIGNRQKLRKKPRSNSNFPASMIENQMPAAMPRIVRPKMTRASSRRRGEFMAGMGSSRELDMAAWCHVVQEGTRLTVGGYRPGRPAEARRPRTETILSPEPAEERPGISTSNSRSSAGRSPFGRWPSYANPVRKVANVVSVASVI